MHIFFNINLSINIKMSTHSGIAKSESWQMFNDISPRYDFLNHFLSFGIDIFWRRQLAHFLPNRDNLSVLDLATGTGDVLLTLVKCRSQISSAVGIDMAEKMLEIGRQKIAQRKLDHKITLQKGDANRIPFADNSFDVTTIAFGIRNMENPLNVLKEMCRVIKSSGRMLILEFSLPENRLLRIIHLFYLRNIVPAIGHIFSGHYQAYKYLNQTIESFPYGIDFCSLMDQAGFARAQAYPLLGGVATIYVGEK